MPHTRELRARPALFVAGLLLVAGSAVACGDDAPTTASEEEFCDTFNSLFAQGGLGEVSDEQLVEEIKEWGRRLEETGTPESMTEEAREGFERTIEALEGLDADAGPEDLARIQEEASDEAQQQMRAFDEFTMSTCDTPLGKVELPSVPEMESPQE